MSQWVVMVILAALSLSAACGRKSEPATRETTGIAPPAGAMPGMPGMTGMGGMMNSGMDSMGTQMQAQMRAMEAAGPAQMQATMPQHRQAVANVLAQMNQQMREMHMGGDQAWSALVDSVRQDLVRLPELKGAELARFMLAHDARVTRLMQMHQRMMQPGAGAKP